MDGILKYYNNAKFHKFDNYCGYMNNIPIPRKYTLKHLGIKEHIVYKWYRGKTCTFIYMYIFIHWRRAWQPTSIFLSRESHGQRSLAGYSPRGRKESDTTEVT